MNKQVLKKLSTKSIFEIWSLVKFNISIYFALMTDFEL